MPAAATRRRAVRAFKREAILDAARAIFGERGLRGATMRAIAEAAGYAPGALYAYYRGKEEIYADLLARSLAGLGRAIRAAIAEADGPPAKARAGALAFYRYYRAHPDELALGLYLAQGLGPTGLTPELDRQLNGRLIGCLAPIAEAIAKAGAPSPEAANAETVAAIAAVCGVLLLEATGRLRVLGFDGQSLVDRHLDHLLERLPAARVA